MKVFESWSVLCGEKFAPMLCDLFERPGQVSATADDGASPLRGEKKRALVRSTPTITLKLFDFWDTNTGDDCLLRWYLTLSR